jgi:hypothetical protein
MHFDCSRADTRLADEPANVVYVPWLQQQTAITSSEQQPAQPSLGEVKEILATEISRASPERGQ